jgi:hypothetical protein
MNSVGAHFLEPMMLHPALSREPSLSQDFDALFATATYMRANQRPLPFWSLPHHATTEDRGLLQSSDGQKRFKFQLLGLLRVNQQYFSVHSDRPDCELKKVRPGLDLW